MKTDFISFVEFFLSSLVGISFPVTFCSLVQKTSNRKNFTIYSLSWDLSLMETDHFIRKNGSRRSSCLSRPFQTYGSAASPATARVKCGHHHRLMHGPPGQHKKGFVPFAFKLCTKPSAPSQPPTLPHGPALHGTSPRASTCSEGERCCRGGKGWMCRRSPLHLCSLALANRAVLMLSPERPLCDHKVLPHSLQPYFKRKTTSSPCAGDLLQKLLLVNL